jgi:hypothetical protein
MLYIGILKTWDPATFKAGVQLADSLTTYLDSITVASSIATTAMVLGNFVLVAIPGGNPKDACVVATWPGGSAGGAISALDDIGDVNAPAPADNDALTWDAASAKWIPEAASPGPHAASHENGGADEISVAGLSGLLADAQTPAAHNASHENGGADEISVAGLSGELADPQPSNFLKLSDTPASYAGLARRYARVNDAETGIELVRGLEWGIGMYPWQFELDFSTWTTTLTGSGAVTEKAYCLHLTTGTTVNSTARGRGYSFGWINFDELTPFEWTIQFRARGFNSTLGKCWIKLDIDTVGDPTDKAFGFRFDYLTLKGIVHDGVTLNVVDLGTTITAWQMVNLFIRFTSGSKIEWYVDGVLKGQSAAIPSGTRAELFYPVLSVANYNEAKFTAALLNYQGWIKPRI